MADDLRRSVAGQLAHGLQRMQVDAGLHKSNALARRAALRQADQGVFGTAPQADAELLKLVRLPSDTEEPPLFSRRLERLLDDAMLVASLVARTGVAVRAPGTAHTSLGQDLRGAMMRHETAVERLMRGLLGADREDLGPRLRTALALLESAAQPLAVDALVRDLGGWDADCQFIQKRWSYDLWAQRDTPQSSHEEKS